MFPARSVASRVTGPAGGRSKDSVNRPRRRPRPGRRRRSARHLLDRPDTSAGSSIPTVGGGQHSSAGGVPSTVNSSGGPSRRRPARHPHPMLWSPSAGSGGRHHERAEHPGSSITCRRRRGWLGGLLVGVELEADLEAAASKVVMAAPSSIPRRRRAPGGLVDDAPTRAAVASATSGDDGAELDPPAPGPEHRRAPGSGLCSSSGTGPSSSHPAEKASLAPERGSGEPRRRVGGGGDRSGSSPP